MIETFVDVRGLKELDAVLSRLPTKVAGRPLRAALRRAAQPMLEAARTNAEKVGIRGFDSGALAAAMVARSRQRGRGTSAAVIIGPAYKAPRALSIYNEARARNFNAKKPIETIRFGHLVEFGTVDTPAQPFMRPAFAATSRQVVDRFAGELRKALEARGLPTGAE